MEERESRVLRLLENFVAVQFSSVPFMTIGYGEGNFRMSGRLAGANCTACALANCSCVLVGRKVE